jgi:hypothetical protein
MAVGIDIEARGASVSWLHYLEIVKNLNINVKDKEGQKWFCVRLFDPKL